ncbi:expressed unknown protein [Seminavis robusta]|uniref:DUF6824 domain-containing protein n=1 Tax=Seminavis robusta TaxID=568900 RepID=A0A9N8DUE0_9STRA|nr:expressed unknown protein [Seminavis robusta]|eukprot:Sro364_g127140.1 n/a (549) ;mRNA; f:37826-40314
MDRSIHPRDTDILCGKSRSCVNHIGSKRYREYLDTYRGRYAQAANKHHKMLLIKEIYENLVPTCRFLTFNKQRNQWEELSANKARDKIGHALRHANATREEPIDEPDIEAISSRMHPAHVAMQEARKGASSGGSSNSPPPDATMQSKIAAVHPPAAEAKPPPVAQQLAPPMGDTQANSVVPSEAQMSGLTAATTVVPPFASQPMTGMIHPSAPGGTQQQNFQHLAIASTLQQPLPAVGDTKQPAVESKAVVAGPARGATAVSATTGNQPTGAAAAGTQPSVKPAAQSSVESTQSNIGWVIPHPQQEWQHTVNPTVAAMPPPAPLFPGGQTLPVASLQKGQHLTVETSGVLPSAASTNTARQLPSIPPVAPGPQQAPVGHQQRPLGMFFPLDMTTPGTQGTAVAATAPAVGGSTTPSESERTVVRKLTTRQPERETTDSSGSSIGSSLTAGGRPPPYGPHVAQPNLGSATQTVAPPGPKAAAIQGKAPGSSDAGSGLERILTEPIQDWDESTETKTPSPPEAAKQSKGSSSASSSSTQPTPKTQQRKKK